jgi:hypothetical protein
MNPENIPQKIYQLYRFTITAPHPCAYIQIMHQTAIFVVLLREISTLKKCNNGFRHAKAAKMRRFSAGNP